MVDEAISLPAGNSISSEAVNHDALMLHLKAIEEAEVNHRVNIPNKEDSETEISPLCMLPTELLHAIFRYLPQKQVYESVSMVCRSLEQATDGYTVYLETIVLQNPSANLLRSLIKKVTGCKSLHVIFDKNRPTREMNELLPKLCEILKFSVESITVSLELGLGEERWYQDSGRKSCPLIRRAYAYQLLLMPLIRDAVDLRSLDVSQFHCWDLTQHDTKLSVEILKCSERFEDLTWLKNFPNLREINCEAFSAECTGISSQEVINIKSLITRGRIPPVFVHLTELYLDRIDQDILFEVAVEHNYVLEMLTQLNRLVVIFEDSREDCLFSTTEFFVRSIEYMILYLPQSLKNVEINMIAKTARDDDDFKAHMQDLQRDTIMRHMLVNCRILRISCLGVEFHCVISQ